MRVPHISPRACGDRREISNRKLSRFLFEQPTKLRAHKQINERRHN
jgi:hypothetical protein